MRRRDNMAKLEDDTCSTFSTEKKVKHFLDS